MANPQLPAITHVLETCLYVRSIADSVTFYKTVFNLEPFLETVITHVRLCHTHLLRILASNNRFRTR
jgi:hypothetical protein